MVYETLVKEMERQQINTRQLAIKAGIVPQSLYGAIHGRVEFWPGWKKRVADVLSVDVEELFPEQ